MHRPFNPVAPFLLLFFFLLLYCFVFWCRDSDSSSIFALCPADMRIMMFWKCIQKMLVATLFVTVKI